MKEHLFPNLWYFGSFIACDLYFTILSPCKKCLINVLSIGRTILISQVFPPLQPWSHKNTSFFRIHVLTPLWFISFIPENVCGCLWLSVVVCEGDCPGQRQIPHLLSFFLAFGWREPGISFSANSVPKGNRFVSVSLPTSLPFWGGGTKKKETKSNRVASRYGSW